MNASPMSDNCKRRICADFNPPAAVDDYINASLSGNTLPITQLARLAGDGKGGAFRPRMPLALIR